jgi:hypothetical protein
LASDVEQSRIVPEFQVRPENDVLIASISFSETRRNLKEPYQGSKEGGGTQLCF